MKKYAILLRGVTPTGKNRVPMADPALVEHGRFMEYAIQTAAQLRPAMRTVSLSSDRIGRDNLLPAGVALFHPFALIRHPLLPVSRQE